MDPKTLSSVTQLFSQSGRSSQGYRNANMTTVNTREFLDAFVNQLKTQFQNYSEIDSNGILAFVAGCNVLIPQIWEDLALGSTQRTGQYASPWQRQSA